METALATLRASKIGTGNAVTQATASLAKLHNVLYAIDFSVVDRMLADLGRVPDVSQSMRDYKNVMYNWGTSMKALERIKGEVDVSMPVFYSRPIMCPFLATCIMRSSGTLCFYLGIFLNWKVDFIQSLNKVQNNIGSQIGQVTDKFSNAILGIARNYVRDTKHSILKDMGKCTPLWNLYDSIVVVSFCKYIVDAFNGFWFSVGWCLFFFVPSIVFSVKLAKHYRTMKDEEHPNGEMGEINSAYDSSTSNHLFRSNKVGHQDSVPNDHYKNTNEDGC